MDINSLELNLNIDDMFHIVDDNKDPLQYTDEELNKYFFSGYLKSSINHEEYLDFNNEINLFETLDKDVDNDIDNKKEECMLSQQFRDLFTYSNVDDRDISSETNKRQRESSGGGSGTTTSSQDKIVKKSKTTDTNMNESDSLPNYLLMTNEKFIDLIQAVNNTATSISMNDIQELALLMHRIAAMTTDREIMKTYFHSVKGTLKQSTYNLAEHERRFYPLNVQTFMLSVKKTEQTSDKITKASTNETSSHFMLTEEEHQMCENHIYQRIYEMKDMIDKLKQQLEDRKATVFGLTPTIEQLIHNFVQKYGIKPLKCKEKLQIALVGDDYENELLKRQYLKENPNEYQVRIHSSIDVFFFSF